MADFLEDHCPWCQAGIRFSAEDIPPGQISGGVCGNCGHAVMVTKFTDGQYGYAKMERAGLVDQLPEFQKALHEEQERIHHQLRQWG